MAAYDAWLQVEMSDKIAERTPDMTGLCIDVQLAGQPTNPDPRRPAPEEILREALHSADIEVNCSGGAYSRDKYALFLTVGHRPHGQPTQRARILYIISRWIQGLAR